MKKMAIYNDVAWMKLVNNNIYFICYKDDFLHKIDKDLTNKVYNFNAVTIKYWQNKIVINSSYFLEDDNLVPIFEKECMLMNLIVDDNRLIALVDLQTENEEREKGLYFSDTKQYKKYQETQKDKSSEGIISKEIYLTSIYPNLYGDSIDSGENIWELDFSLIFDWDEISFFEFPKVVNGIIYLCLRDKYYQNFAFVAVDGLTGKIIFQDNDFLGSLYPHNRYIYSIYSDGMEIQRRNTQTFELEKFDIDMGDAPKLHIEDKTCFFKDNEMFLAAKDYDDPGYVYPYWGILDLNTMKIIYWEELLRNPKRKSSTGNRIYVHEILAYDDKVAVKVPEQIILYQRD